jgi:hypothetical protein
MMILTSSHGLKGKVESFATAEGVSEKGKDFLTWVYERTNLLQLPEDII